MDYSYPSDDGEPTWSTDPNERFALDPKSDEFGDYTERVIQTLNILDDSFQHMTPLPTIRANQHVLSSNKHVLSNDTNQHVLSTNKHVLSNGTTDYEHFRQSFGWVNVDTVQKTIEQSTQWGVSIPHISP